MGGYMNYWDPLGLRNVPFGGTFPRGFGDKVEGVPGSRRDVKELGITDVFGSILRVREFEALG